MILNLENNVKSKKYNMFNNNIIKHNNNGNDISKIVINQKYNIGKVRLT